MNVGIDIVEIARINESLAARVLSTSELSELNNIQHPSARLQFIASRFAAKEALFKATQTTLEMNEVSIAHTSEGKPIIIEYPEASLSISHEEHYAVAIVII